MALILNLALTYVLMLAPSRQYIEAFALDALSSAFPLIFKSLQLNQQLKGQEAEANRGQGEEGGEGGEEVEDEEEEEEEVGQWSPGVDGWARCTLRNVVRGSLVLLTAQLSLAVPHFALLSGKRRRSDVGPP